MGASGLAVPHPALPMAFMGAFWIILENKVGSNGEQSFHSFLIYLECFLLNFIYFFPDKIIGLGFSLSVAPLALPTLQMSKRLGGFFFGSLDFLENWGGQDLAQK